MKSRGIHNAFHVSLLRPNIEDTFERDPSQVPAVIFDDGQQEFEVEKILSHRNPRGQVQYLVKWKGYHDHENTGQNKKDLKNCPERLQDYEASRRYFS